MKPATSKMWKDPVKGKSAKAATLAIEGDFDKFSDLMKRIIKKKPTREEKQPNAASSSLGPVVS